MPQSEFGHIIDAIDHYIGLQRPTLAERKKFEELVKGYIGVMPIAVGKLACSKIAACPQVPKTILSELLNLPAEVCRPLLLSRQHFDASLFETIISLDLEKARIIARNTNIDMATMQHLRSFFDQKIDQALDLRQRPIDKIHSTGHQEKSVYEEPHGNAATSVLQSIDEDNDTLIHTALADALSLSIESITFLCGDPTSRNLPTALHFLRLTPDQAWSVYSRITSGFSSNDGVRRAFLSVYEGLDRNETNTVVSKWQMDELISIVRENGAANDRQPAHPLLASKDAS